MSATILQTFRMKKEMARKRRIVYNAVQRITMICKGTEQNH